MIQRVVESSGLEWFAIVGLILFFVAFILVLIRVMLMDSDEANRRANIPLDDEMDQASGEDQ
jgi:hypothetical protein